MTATPGNPVRPAKALKPVKSVPVPSAPPAKVQSKPDPLAPIGPMEFCDQCGGAAFFRATYSTGELLFCGHHGYEFLSQRSNAKGRVIILDETYRLYAK